MYLVEESIGPIILRVFACKLFVDRDDIAEFIKVLEAEVNLDQDDPFWFHPFLQQLSDVLISSSPVFT